MKQTTLYLECNSGISGDMTVAALLDLGADRQVLTDALASLPLTGYSIEIKDVFKSGIRACDFNVILEHENHDHDMNYLHGHMHAHIHEHSHAHPHDSLPEDMRAHTHSDDSSHEHLNTPSLANSHTHAPHHHDARNLDDIVTIIHAGHLTSGARELAIRIFRLLAEAEASVHGKSVSEVHFHEVGAVDSIVDIVSAAVCIDNLAPDAIVVSPLTDGTGQIRCQHGLIPVPVPAVAAIAARNHLTLKISDVEGELVTPTGAAIAAAVQSEAVLPEKFQIKKLGFGAGKRDYASTGLLRAMLIEPAKEELHDTIWTLETNIDDCTGEALSFTLQQLLEHGALDAFCIPIYMKKNRPAYLLKAICSAEKRKELESIIFHNTTTIGIRVQEMQRTKLERKILAVETPWGMADVKCCTNEDETYYYPENDSVSQLAKQTGIGFPEMYNMIQAYIRENSHIVF